MPVRYLTPEERMKVTNSNFSGKVADLWDRQKPQHYTSVATAQAQAVHEQQEAIQSRTEICKSAISWCDDVSREEMDAYIRHGVDSFQKSVSAVEGTNSSVNAAKRRAVMANILLKAAADPTKLYPYEVDLLGRLNNSIHQALSNGFNRINTNFIDKVSDYFEHGTNADAGKPIPFVPLLANVAQDIYKSENAKNAFFASIEDIVWSEKGQLLDLIRTGK